MWNPLRPKGSFASDLFGPGTVDVGDQRAAFLICYEQLLAWPMLRSALEHPTTLIAISNEAGLQRPLFRASSTHVHRRGRGCLGFRLLWQSIYEVNLRCKKSQTTHQS
jgi:hypothetical protein